MRLEIPDVPPSLNKVLRMHWAKRKKLMENWILSLAGAASASERYDLRHSLRPKEVSITLRHSRAYDTDNAYGACKIVCDAMVKLGYLVDDAGEWLKLTVEQEKCPHKQRHTVIEVSDAQGV
jgi:hypothetical protein